MILTSSRRRGAITTLSTVTALCALAASLPAAAGDMRVTGDALQQVFAGKTLTGTTHDGKTWETRYAADGKFEVSLVDSEWSDEGTWEIKNGMFCSERSRRPWRCQDVYRTGPGQFELVDSRGETMKAAHVN